MELSHSNLIVWKRARALVSEIYRLTAEFPAEEKFGLTSQMRRAAVSIFSNIAEGAARDSHREFLQFLNVARGSLAELDTQYQVSIDLDFAPKNPEFEQNIEEIFATLSGLIRQTREKIGEPDASAYASDNSSSSLLTSTQRGSTE